MTEFQLLIVVALIFGTGMTYWGWAISNTLMDILRVLLDVRAALMDIRTLQERKP